MQRSQLGLLIVGMHRSGTSALAGTITKLGIDAPGDLLTPDEYNEKGYFENARVLALHERVLESIGSSWSDPSPFAPDWLNSPAALRSLAELDQVVETEFGGADTFTVKDPRLCRLLPLWLTVLARKGIAVKILLPVRHPLEVARSVNARNGLPHPRALLLWLQHVLSAEKATRSLPRAVIFYDDLIADWRKAIAAAAKQLDLVWPRDLDIAAPDIGAFLSSDLKHRTIAAAEMESNRLTRLCERAWEAYGALVRSPYDIDAQASLDDISRTLDDSAEVLGWVLQGEIRWHDARDIERSETLRQHNDVIAAIGKRHSDEIAQAANQHLQEIASIGRRHEVEIATIGARHESEVTEAADRHLQEIASIGERHEAEIATIGARHESEVTEAADRHLREIASLGQRHEAEIAEIGARHEREIAQLREDRLTDMMNHQQQVDAAQALVDTLKADVAHWKEAVEKLKPVPKKQVGYGPLLVGQEAYDDGNAFSLRIRLSDMRSKVRALQVTQARRVIEMQWSREFERHRQLNADEHRELMARIDYGMSSVKGEIEARLADLDAMIAAQGIHLHGKAEQEVAEVRLELEHQCNVLTARLRQLEGSAARIDSILNTRVARAVRSSYRGYRAFWRMLGRG